MASFYTGVDKSIYEGGDHFLSMDKFRLNPYEPKNLSFDSQPQSSGITNTNAFTYNNNNQNYYPGTTSNLVSNFNRDIQAYNEGIKEGNRPMRPERRTANYNMPGQGVFTPAEQPTLKRRISDFAYDHIPGINRPQSYEDIMTSGYIQPRSLVPGIMGIMSNFGLKNYASLPQSDQAFIASKRGYTGPTIFGDNTTGLNTDPFGINVDSMFGNYAEYSKKESARLDKQIEKSQKSYIDKYGSLDDENEYGKSWYEMNKVNLARKGFYNQNVTDTQNITSDLSLIDKARAYDIQRTQAGIDKDEQAINEAAKQGKATGSVNPAVDSTYSGGTANPHTDTGWSGSQKGAHGTDTSGNFAGKGTGNPFGRKDGGRIYLNLGGLARLL
jgi:hypothetical protein